LVWTLKLGGAISISALWNGVQIYFDAKMGLKTNLTRKAVGAPFFSVFNRISGKTQCPPDY